MSKHKKVIVIPDIHNRINCVKQILIQESPYDRAVFLGDWFDDFGDSATSARRTALALKNSLLNPKHVHLWGNHDLGYCYDNIYAICSGWSHDKKTAIADIIRGNEWNLFKFFHIEQNWLLSHAGYSFHYLPPVLPNNKVNLQNISNYLFQQNEQASVALDTNQEHWFYRFGDSRTNNPRGVKCGGLVWADMNAEFKPIKGINQIFGHTIQPRPLATKSDSFDMQKSYEFKQLDYDGEILPDNKGWSLCLDTNSRHYGVIEGGKLTVKRTLPKEGQGP